MPRRLVTFLAAALALVGAPQIAAQTPTLDGERLDGGANPTLGIGAVTLDCNPMGTSTGSYTVVGNAIGQFPGTFEERASFTIVGGQVTAFEADFTISSGLVTIEGTKTLRTSTSARCLEAPEGDLADFVDFSSVSGYEATITTPFGPFTDQGRVLSGGQMGTTFDGRASAATQGSFISEGLVVTPTAGHAAGGGYIGDVVSEWVSFGFTAKGDGTTVKAQCSVTDRSTGAHIKCLSATLLAQTGTHAILIGQARVDGVDEPVGYRIDVDDLGEPGVGRDTFKIQTENGFTASGVLTGGNIQIHD